MNQCCFIDLLNEREDREGSDLEFLPVIGRLMDELYKYFCNIYFNIQFSFVSWNNRKVCEMADKGGLLYMHTKDLLFEVGTILGNHS